MSNSLRDQLLKAGLVSEEQVRQAEQTRRDRGRVPRKKSKSQGKKAPRTPPQAAKPEAARKAAPQPPQGERKSKRQQAREAARERKLMDRQLEAILAEAAQNDPDAAVAHHFTRGSKIKHLYVTERQQAQLAAGELSIVGFHGRHYLVACHDAQRLSDIDSKLFIFRHDPEAPDSEAEHPVPDDLEW